MKTDYKITIIIILATLIVLIGGIWLLDKSDKKNRQKLSISMMGEKMTDEGSKHVSPGEEHPPYKTNPPTSGYHWAGVAGPGIKTKPVADELVLHSMEHGAVVVWYKEGLDESEIDKIKDAFQSASGKKIMLSRKDLDVPVALTSWGYLLKLETIDQEKIKEFIEINNDRAPEKAAI
ncbi:MAG: DUF3105 domain-containing protein [Candidatus Paceibacterota bacterium]